MISSFPCAPIDVVINKKTGNLLFTLLPSIYEKFKGSCLSSFDLYEKSTRSADILFYVTYFCFRRLSTDIMNMKNFQIIDQATIIYSTPPIDIDADLETVIEFNGRPYPSGLFFKLDGFTFEQELSLYKTADNEIKAKINKMAINADSIYLKFLDKFAQFFYALLSFNGNLGELIMDKLKVMINTMVEEMDFKQLYKHEIGGKEVTIGLKEIPQAVVNDTDFKFHLILDFNINSPTS